MGSRNGFRGVSGLIHARKIEKKINVFFAAFGTKKIELGGPIMEGAGGVRRGCKPRALRENLMDQEPLSLLKITSKAKFEIASRQVEDCHLHFRFLKNFHFLGKKVVKKCD